MRVIHIDDDKSMLLIMKRMLSKIPDVEIVGSFQSTGEAYQFIKEGKVDLAFIDISMPEENGLDFARRASEVTDIAFVFLTAHKEYALEAFEVYAFDYIVKPISQTRLENSIQRARQRLGFRQLVREEAAFPKLSVYCLGGMEVKWDTGETVQFGSSKSSELLAYLLAKNGRNVSKWSIMETVFRGMPEQNAETYLNTTVYKIRKALEPYGMKSAVITAEESYKIDMKDIYVDFIDFESRVTAFSEFNNLNEVEAINTEKLFMGELFGEKDYFWAMSLKERLSEMYWGFAKKLSVYLLEANNATAALQILKKLLNLNEFDEEVNCLLMRIYAAQRDRILLERQFMRYEKALEKELGVSPEETIIKLYSTLKKSLE